MRALLCVAIAAAVAVTVGACSAFAPSQSTTTTGSRHDASRALVQAQRTHEYSGPHVHESAIGLPTPVAAIEVFATAYVNWTSATVSARMRALAKLSIGQARSAVLLAAAQTAQDYELQRAGIANSGTVEAISPLLHGGDEYAVVTREQTSASNTTAYQGLKPAWHLALATVARVAPGAWAVSSWQPEN